MFMIVIEIFESIVAFLVEVELNTAVSAAAGMLSVDQLAPHDHLFPSPALPPQVPSVPPPSQVTVAAFILCGNINGINVTKANTKNFIYTLLKY
jgi:ribose/xylose/arabinose/galactoside ABC-type transport system permease subunit